jgi:hypothetical protein
MPNTLKLAPDLYTNPGKTAIPGMRVDFRKISLVVGDLITTQIVALGILPAGHRLMHAFIESASLDSNTTTTITVTVGVLNTYYNESPAGTTGIKFNAGSTPQSAADYSSGGQTATDVDPQLVTGQNIITASTIPRAGGRVDVFSLAFSTAIGIDTKYDRIIAIQFPALPATAAAGVFGLGLVIDEP